MTQGPTIKHSELARHWKTSPAYISKLARTTEDGGKGMPKFGSLEEADLWRAAHAPKRAGNDRDPGSLEILPTEAEKNSRSSQPQQPGETTVTHLGDVVDIAPFVNHQADFTGIMIGQAKEVPQIAFGLYKLACTRNRVSQIHDALANWNSAARASSDILARYLEIQERAKVLIAIDLVMDVVGTELQTIRSSLLKLGERTAPRANPSNPILAQTVINAAVDEILKQFTHACSITKAEFSA